jgi:hypothetical protein
MPDGPLRHLTRTLKKARAQQPKDIAEKTITMATSLLLHGHELMSRLMADSKLAPKLNSTFAGMCKSIVI